MCPVRMLTLTFYQVVESGTTIARQFGRVTVMAIELPNDILYLICTQLSEQKDFNTLFNCALTGRQLAVPALMHLYRYCVTLRHPS